MMEYPLVLDFVVVLGIIVTATILLLLFQKKKKHTPQYLLIAFFVIVLFIFFEDYSFIHKIKWLYATSFVFTSGTGFIVGPLIYFYIKSLYTELSFSDRNVWPHLIPFVCYFSLHTLPYLFSNPPVGEIPLYLKFIIKNMEVLFIIECIFMIVYATLALKIIRNMNLNIKDFYSDFHYKDALWSRRLIWVLLIYLSVELILTFYYFLSNIEVKEIYFIPFLELGLVGYLGYFGFYQSQVLIPSFLLDKINDQANKKHTNGSNPAKSFSAEEVLVVQKKLDQAFKKEKLFLNESLTLPDVAKAVDMTDKNLSTFINKELKTNFYELVNGHRILEFTKQVIRPENEQLTIWGIANSCGFKSKTSFNRTFKRQIGTTPSKYLKKHKTR